MDLNEPVANQTTEVAGQRGPLKTLEFREARGRNRAGLNQRRQKVNCVPRTPDPRIAFSKARVRSRLRRRAAVQTHCRVATKSTCSGSILRVYTLLLRAVKAHGRQGHDPKSLTSVSFATDLILRRPLRQQRASKDTPDRAHSHACARWNAIRGPLRGASGRGRWVLGRAVKD